MGAYRVTVTVKDHILDDFIELAEADSLGEDVTDYAQLHALAKIIAVNFQVAIAEAEAARESAR